MNEQKQRIIEVQDVLRGRDEQGHLGSACDSSTHSTCCVCNLRCPVGLVLVSPAMGNGTGRAEQRSITVMKNDFCRKDFCAVS